MNVILKEIEKIVLKTGYYTNSFWEQVNEFADRNDKKFSDFLMNYLEKLDSENFDRKDCQMVLALILAIYPFDSENINDFRNSHNTAIRELSKLEMSIEDCSRDHLLYLIMDILFHTPEIIMDANIEVQEKLFESISNVGELKYSLNHGSDSYLMNYNIIHFYKCFNNVDWQAKLADMYLNHFDPRIRNEIKYELENS